MTYRDPPPFDANTSSSSSYASQHTQRPVTSGWATGPRRCTRARERVFAGVCAGIGKHFEVSVPLVRFVWLLAIFLAGTGFFLYMLLWWILPVEGTPQAQPIPATACDGPFRRSRTDRKLLGVCAGLGRRWCMDPSAVRLLAVGLASLSMGLAVIVYFAVALCWSVEELPPLTP